MGTNVDCYQRAEGRYRLMPDILRALSDVANPFSILTKGALILRDLPLLERAADVADVSAAVSVGCLDEDLWRTVGAGHAATAAPARCRAHVHSSGIRAGVLMAPILPVPHRLRRAARGDRRRGFHDWSHARHPDRLASASGCSRVVVRLVAA